MLPLYKLQHLKYDSCTGKLLEGNWLQILLPNLRHQTLLELCFVCTLDCEQAERQILMLHSRIKNASSFCQSLFSIRLKLIQNAVIFALGCSLPFFAVMPVSLPVRHYSPSRKCHPRVSENTYLCVMLITPFASAGNLNQMHPYHIVQAFSPDAALLFA